MYLEPCKTSEVERFVKIVNCFQLLIIFAKRSILDVWQGFEYPFGMRQLTTKYIKDHKQHVEGIMFREIHPNLLVPF